MPRTAPARAKFIGALVLGSGALLAELARPRPAEAAVSNDREILNFALVLEYLQASFYTEAERRKTLTKGKLATIPSRLGAVERAHVTAFKRALGSVAVKRPAFDFAGTTEQSGPFLQHGRGARGSRGRRVQGSGAQIRITGYLAAAISIHSVEARHAAWMRYLLGRRPAANAFDKPISAAEAERLVASTHFIVSKAKTSVGRSPRFTG